MSRGSPCTARGVGLDRVQDRCQPRRISRKRAAQRGKGRRSARRTGSRTRVCALRAREVAWRHAGSTGDRGASKVLASATDLLLDEKRCHAPLLLHIQHRREGVSNLGLVDHVERDEPQVVADLSWAGWRGRSRWSCVHTPPHNQAKKSDDGQLEQQAIGQGHRERQAYM